LKIVRLINIVVHNPGALPQSPYFDASTTEEADLTIVFENSFSNWTSENTKLMEATLSYDRKKLAVVIHSIPELTNLETASTLQQVLSVGHGVWMTGSGDYTQFDAVLPLFVDSLAALLI
jgi:hypothetical protein